VEVGDHILRLVLDKSSKSSLKNKVKARRTRDKDKVVESLLGKYEVLSSISNTPKEKKETKEKKKKYIQFSY
jgi:hypothetical protein